MIGPN